MSIANPRRNPKSRAARSHWYPYYAGYSAEFAERILANAALSSASRVADPWNGGGTTTAVASRLGLCSWGGDLNPAMVIVARARSASPALSKDVRELARALAAEAFNRQLGTNADPLSMWVPGWRHLRLIEIELRNWCGSQNTFPEIPGELDTLGCILYLALFRTARRLAVGSDTSNPTWVRKTVLGSKEANYAHACSEFLAVAEALAVDLEREAGTERYPIPTTIDLAKSENIPLKEGSIDLILTSPPYCTRIDYAVATSIELAVLGYGIREREGIRRTLIGRTTIDQEVPEIDQRWGRTCLALLEAIRSHPSKASSSYYYKSHLQYFEGLFLSIREAARVLKPCGQAIFVVQDSYYKNIRTDLAGIVEEMFASCSMGLSQRADFQKLVNMRSVNTISRSYGIHAPPIESVLRFEGSK